MVKIRAGWLLPAILFAGACAVVHVRADATHAPAAAQPPASPAPAAAPATAGKDEGLPIRSELVLQKCGGCHKVDDQKRLSRISYRRATPENWEHTIRRMVTLNKVALEPADARKILKYLSDQHGLAPEEARPVAFEAERRMVDVSYDADKETATVCSSCHSIGRWQSERRTNEEWSLLLAMHRGYYPLVDNQPMNQGQGFRRTRAPQTEPGADGRPPDNRQPMDRVIAHLSKAYPLSTPEWAEWSAASQPANLTGKWALSGYAAGKGQVFGQVTVTADPADPESFTTETRYTFVKGGQTVTRKGKGTVYTGFQWRGRGSANGPTAPGAAAPVATSTATGTSAAAGEEVWREVMFVERTRKEMWGRWFTGSYDETGLDVKLVKVTSDPVVLGLSTAALKTSSTGLAVTIIGANLPSGLAAADINLGQGIKVSKIGSISADAATITLDVAADALPGPRDVSVAGAVKTAAVTVFKHVDGIKILPRAGMARVGGGVFPKQLQQFEAVAFHNGPDGKPNTKDDLSIGQVDVAWKLEEYTATFGDDDLAFVGSLDPVTGLFTPNIDGPNPKRTGERNNVGDVWVVGELAPNAALGTTKPMRARAHLLVTVPIYRGWPQGGAPASSSAPGTGGSK
jgi:quinohemoprotein amine dehydrogenase